MGHLTRAFRRLRLLLRGRLVERAMDDEIRQHIESDTAERIEAGETPEAARRSALIAFGGIERTREEARDASGVRLAQDLVADVRYASRVLRRQSAATVVSILTFAIGVGAATAIFSVVYGVLFRPLPYRDPAALVVLWERNPHNGNQNVVSADNYEAWRSRTRSFSGLAAVMPTSATIGGGATAERVPGAEVTPGYFTLLGIQPELGHDFSDDDARGGSTVVLSHAYWQRRFGMDTSLVGQAITIGDRQVTVAGVMPASFDPPRMGWLGEQQLWFPMSITAAQRSYGRYLLVVGRLKPGISAGTANAEMTAVAAQLSTESTADIGWSAAVVTLADQISGDVRTSLLIVLAAVALLLTMAVANVATLTLSSLQQRRAELAVRRAIGATDSRLFRQLFVQSLIVGTVGAVAGLIAAVPGTHLLVSLMPDDMPRVSSIATDVPVLAVMTLVTLTATVVFGTLAARRGRAASYESLLGRAADDGRVTSRTGGSLLVSAEIALALAVSVMALLMVRSFASLSSVGLGFDPRGVVAARVAAPRDTYNTPESQRRFFRDLRERLAAIPGVESASVTSVRPFGGLGSATGVGAADAPPAPPGTLPTADVRFVDASVFDTLRTPIIAGRTFVDLDRGGPPRVVINADLARVVWPGQDAIGRKIRLGMFGGITPEVIGVVGDAHLFDTRRVPRPAAFLSVDQFPDSERDILVRTSADPSSVVPSMRAALAGLEPGVPLYRVETLPALVGKSLALDRFTMVLLSAFAAVAMTLAAVGIFGVFAADVGRRRKEIGLRLALGGSSNQVMVMLLSRALARSVTGLAAGLLLAYGLGQSMRSLLFGVSPADPLSWLIVTASLSLLAVLATMVPAVRALQTSPLRALREG